jgi:methylenetetrahydrofolate dehydrogenase (NADP+)/methenyltetrahydrofolate cyclohydrolase
MSAKIIDGKAVAQRIRSECAERVRLLELREGIAPGLAVILVGDDPASRVYVSNKVKACESVGIRSFNFRFPCEIDEATILDTIIQMNADPLVHGILVQLPLPAHIDTGKVIRTISVDKDVDGFHLYNVGGLVVGDTIFSPCTPYGVIKLLESENIPISGQNVVIVGASNIVGKPMALMLMKRDATVAVCHAKTRDLAQLTIMADILIVAAGHPNLIVPQMVKRGAVVIDVGINRLPNGKLTGDVDFEGLLETASFITPVPGGVGPMTVTMLLVNTIVSAQNSIHLRQAKISA